MFTEDLVYSNASLVYICSPGGAHPSYLCNDRDVFWEYPYPVNGSQWTITLNVDDILQHRDRITHIC